MVLKCTCGTTNGLHRLNCEIWEARLPFDQFADELNRRQALRDPFTPSLGDIVREIDHLIASSSFPMVPRTQLKRWKEGLIFAGACLDPDNPPLSHDELKKMKRRTK
jgi:hypothetical protein